MHDLPRQPLLHQLRRQLRRYDDDRAALLRRGETLLLAAVDQQLFRRQPLPRHLHRLARARQPRDRRKLRLRHRRERPRDVLHLPPVLLAEELEVRLHLEAQEVRLVAHDAQLLDVQLLQYLRRQALQRVLLHLRRQFDEQLRDRLPHAKLRLRSRRPPERRHPHHEPRLVGQPSVDPRRIGLRPIRQMHALRRPVLPSLQRPTSSDQVLVHLLREERRERREHLRERDEALVQRRVRRQLVAVALGLPEPAAAPAHVPVRQIVDERLDELRRRQRIEILQPIGHALHQLVQLRQHPAIQLRPLQ